MRLLRTQPKTERLVLRLLLQKPFEVARVILWRDSVGGRLESEFVEARSCRIVLPAGRFEIARPPALSGEPDEVARLLQKVGVDLKLARENAVVIDRFFQLPGVASGQNRRAARAALGIRGEG